MNNETSKPAARFALFAWIVIGIALALRLLHVFFTERYNPLAGDLQVDAATYDRWARALAFGGDPGETTLMQAPIYPWFLTIVYRIAGPSLAAVRLVQAVLGAATVGLILLCTWRFFKSAAASMLAGIFAALYTPFIFYEGILVPATLVVFLNILFIAVLLTEKQAGIARTLVSGIVLGLAVAANPPTLLLLPFALLHLFLVARHVDDTASQRASVGVVARPIRLFALTSLALIAGLIIALAPVTIRNALRTDEFIPLTTGGGINFYIGNNDEATGFYALPRLNGKSLGGTPEEQARNMQKIASAESGRDLSQSGVSKFWFDAGLDYVRTNPGAWAALLWQKSQYFWNRYERSNVENMYFHRRFPGILRLPLFTFGIIAPLALLGIFLTRSRWSRLTLLYGGILTYSLTTLVFYVLARYRVPVVPFLTPLAGAAVVELVAIARSHRRAELGLSLAALGLLAFFSNMTVASDTPQGVSSNLARLGNAYIARGDTASAEKAYREALDLNAENASAKEGLAKITSSLNNPISPRK
jgi:4-amino-4-deoxy-L-arabinose transferase-like glycosyltransferase